MTISNIFKSKASFRRVFQALGRIGKALMFPIAVLPIAAIIMRIGAQIPINGNIVNAPTFVTFVQKTLAAVGDTVFSNLHILFAIGVGFGLTKDSRGEAAITAFVGMTLLTLLMKTSGADLPHQIYGGVFDFHSIFGKSYDNILSNNVLNGIIMGSIVAFIYNRFNDIELPKILGFFSGRRLIPVLVIISSLFFTLFWAIIFPWIGWGLYKFSLVLSEATTNRWASASISGIYVSLNRLLIPFGLHHIPNTLFWFVLGEHKDSAGKIINGDINIFLNGVAEGNTAGVFQSGFFPMMMFGLPALVFVFYKNANDKEQQKRVLSLFLPSALIAFMTGITEPIEFAFMFVSPVLYLAHALLSGVFAFMMGAFGIQIGFGFSAGLIDYLLSIPKSMEIIAANKVGASAVFGNPAWIFVIGPLCSLTYFFTANTMIKKMNISTPGRGKNILLNENEVVEIINENELPNNIKKIIIGLGGWDNIINYQNCVTRLRYDLKDISKIDENIIKESGIVIGNKKIQNHIQLIIGPKAESINNLIIKHKNSNLN